METVAVTIGLVGVVINLIAYAMVTAGRMHTDEVRYQVNNIVGTVFILISLTAQWNLPSFIANVAWLLIGVVGLARILRQRKRGA